MNTVSPVCESVRFDAFEVDFGRWELRCNGRRIKLQRKPFQILRRLLENPGEAVTRSELAAILWPDLHVNFERSLNTAVNVLRDALEDCSRPYRFIETCPGVGYRFVAPVEQIAAAAARAREAPAVPHDCRRARSAYDKLSADSLARAAAYYRAALEAEPQCAYAYAGLGEIECCFAVLSMTPSAFAGCHALRLAEQALAIDAELPEAQVIFATARRILADKSPEIESSLADAVERAPGCVSIRCWYADFLCADGRGSEALAQLSAAETSDPASLVIHFQRAWTLYLRRDFRSAVESSWNALMLDPGFAAAQYTLGLAYAQLQQWDEAVTELQNARGSSDHPPAAASLCHALVAMGEGDRARGLLDQLRRSAETQFISKYWLAMAALAVEGREAALGYLAGAEQEKDFLLCWLPFDPRFDALQR